MSPNALPTVLAASDTTGPLRMRANDAVAEVAVEEVALGDGVRHEQIRPTVVVPVAPARTDGLPPCCRLAEALTFTNVAPSLRKRSLFTPPPFAT